MWGFDIERTVDTRFLLKFRFELEGLAGGTRLIRPYSASWECDMDAARGWEWAGVAVWVQLAMVGTCSFEIRAVSSSNQ